MRQLKIKLQIALSELDNDSTVFYLWFKNYFFLKQINKIDMIFKIIF